MMMTNSWDCPVCGQVVEYRDDGRALRPQTAYENCKLKKHYVGDVCIGYHDLGRARKLAIDGERAIVRSAT